MTTDTTATPRSRTFTRITVASTNGRIDIAAPDDMSIPELLRTLVVGLGEDVGAAWVLEHPTRGVIRPPETLGSFGVLDGEVLNLRPDVEGPLPVAVDDVADSVGASVSAGTWRPGVARPFGTALLAVWLAALAVTSVIARGADEAIVTAGFAFLIAGAAVAVARGLGSPVQQRIAGVGAAASGGLLGLAIGVRLEWAPLATAALILALAIGGAVLARVIAPNSSPAVRPTLMVLVTLAETLLLCAVLGIWLKGTAHLVSVVLVVMLAILGTATEQALTMSGLVSLDQQASQGVMVTENSVQDRLYVARRDLLGLLLSLSVTVAVLATVLAITGGRPGLLVAGLALLIVLTRARTYVAPAHVMALVIPTLAAVFAAACAAVLLINQLMLGAMVLGVGALILGVAAFYTARPVEASRFRRILDWVERLAILAVVPSVLWLFDAYATALHHFK